MKKDILKIIVLFLIAGFVMTACDEESKNIYDGPATTHFTSKSGEFVAASDDEVFLIELGTTTSASASVSVVISDESTAIEGVHFQQFEKTVSIGSGEFVSSLQISPIVSNLENAVTLILEIPASGEEELGFNQTYTLSLARLCPVEDLTVILGDRSGIDVTIDGLGWDPYASEVVISGSVDALKVTGLGIGWMTDFWGEVIITMEEVEMEVVDGLYVTIPEQAYMTTTYNGAPQPAYTIVGTGVLDNCAKTLTIRYDLKQGDSSWGSWTSSNGYMSDALFTAVLDIP